MKGKVSVLLTVIACCIPLASSAERECSVKQYGILTPDSRDCSKYYRCEGQINTQNFYWKNEECPPYEYFNWTVSNCMPNYGSCKNALITPYIHCRDNETLLDPSDARQHFLCENGIWVLRTCAYKYLYNETQGQCSLGKQCEAGTVKHDYDDCSQYFICNKNAEWVLMKCKPELYFNRDSMKCDYDVNDVCNQKFTNMPKSTTINPKTSSLFSTIKLKIIATSTTIKPKINSQPITTIKPKSNSASTTKKTISKSPPTTNKPKTNPSTTTYAPDKCIEKTTKPDLHDCARYFTCKNGTWQLNLCPENHYFDIFFLDCRTDKEHNCNSSSFNNNNKKEFLCEENSLRADENNCMKYFKCSNEMWIPILCGKGTYYNEKQQKCIRDNGICIDTLFEVTPKIITSNNCDEGETKLDPFDCGRYFQCTNDKWISKECDSTKYYEIFKKQCVLNNGQCDRSSDEDKKTTSKNVERYLCTTGETKPDHFDCTRYYTCKNEKWVPTQCKHNMYYDDDENKCILDDGTCNEDFKNNPTNKETIKFSNKNCKKGETKAHIFDCKKYYRCSEESIWAASKCERDMYYNSEKKRCIINDGSCHNDDVSEDEKLYEDTCKHGDIKEDKISCNRYYYCRNGDWVLLSCPQRYYFNESKTYCLPNIGNCKATVADSKISQCTEGKFKLNQKDDTKYYECINTKWVAKNCKKGLIFNMESGECEKQFDNEKYMQEKDKKEEKIVKDENCEDGVQKKHGDNKQSYYTCFDGAWRLKTCPDGFVFDSSSTICMPDMNLRNVMITKLT